MLVKELIEKLQSLENQNLPVYIWTEGSDIQKISLIDELSDRVDINIEE